MRLDTRKGAARRLRKTLALVFWIVSCSSVFIVCGRMLWLAYTTHWTFMPLRRAAGRWVLLEQEPGFFWSALVIYALVFLCGPVAVASLVGDLIEQIRGRRRRLRQKGFEREVQQSFLFDNQ
jgi:NhaP-type Na+/H+ or K+/H+ antiporter